MTSGRLALEGNLKMPKMVAALAMGALLTTAAYAQPDKDNGPGKSGGKQISPAHAQHGNAQKDQGPKDNDTYKARKPNVSSNTHSSPEKPLKPAKAKFENRGEQASDHRVERRSGNVFNDQMRQVDTRRNDVQRGFARHREQRKLIDG